MRHNRLLMTMKRQIACIFIGVMVGTIGSCLLVNHLLLEKVYIKNKQNVLINAYDSMNDFINSGDIGSSEFDVKLQKVSDMYNISLLIIDEKSNAINVAGGDIESMLRHLYDNFFQADLEQRKRSIVADENYELALSYDIETGTEYLELWGVFDKGYIFLVRTPLESIRESVSLSNQFIIMVGVVATIISSALIWWLTTRITKPITELTEISTRMIHLDFESKYKGKVNNEIDLLGNHMNLLSDTLEKTISELKTANIELQNDIKKREQIDEMRKEFLSNVSHELKTPISLIQGYAEGLKEGISEDEESRDFYCDVIVDEASKMNTLVKKLLDLNQLEFGNETVVMERFDIDALIRNLLTSADLLIKQQNIQVKLDCKGPIFVWADEFKIEEVVRNYFSNAMNHVDQNKLITIDYEIFEDKVRVTVFNTGELIPEEALPRVWEKFYKVDKARTREYGGSGVGLSIVKAIMELLNQGYGVENRENGVAFWFELETK